MNVELISFVDHTPRRVPRSIVAPLGPKTHTRSITLSFDLRPRGIIQIWPSLIFTNWSPYINCVVQMQAFSPPALIIPFLCLPPRRVRLCRRLNPTRPLRPFSLLHSPCSRLQSVDPALFATSQVAHPAAAARPFVQGKMAIRIELIGTSATSTMITSAKILIAGFSSISRSS